MYLYLGLENGILHVLSRNPEYAENKKCIDLKVNIDGLPLFKSNSDTIWLILASFFFFFPDFSPFIVAMYYGKDKPNSVSEFLEDFVDKWQYLKPNSDVE